MTVQEIIDRLNKVKDKNKEIKMVVHTGYDFTDVPFVEESVPFKVNETDIVVELVDEVIDQWSQQGVECV
ncbi:hypothetical protein BKP56_09195 [Marinilactibacillus sp. 15R]|uniref:hypothetical protein n=1 Tax=Marinilactibacillus sp. 15R TaxID=1911586 RepID=UPI00090AE4A5|nr:hypothetical protein [Marinilactibacillus sp. 15R]API89419.1 hypothetical protein BKP56_09195 [Marinilactibacillus sp. 15R]